MLINVIFTLTTLLLFRNKTVKKGKKKTDVTYPLTRQCTLKNMVMMYVNILNFYIINFCLSITNHQLLGKEEENNILFALIASKETT